MKIINYEILIVPGQDYTALDTLKERVSLFLSLGWEPLGGVVATGEDLLQTMIRRSEKDE